MALLVCFDGSEGGNHPLKFRPKSFKADSTITVDKSGDGNFTSVQAAVDSVPLNNNAWICIHLKADTYTEKVQITKERQFIYLEGEGRSNTVIRWGDAGDVTKSSTFSLFADNFMAAHLTIKNTYDAGNITWAPAAMLMGDKALFYKCGFVSIQDTLTDSQGRHFFDSCYIESAMDFIWGSGQSVYQGCSIHAVADRLRGGPGYITAQGRSDSSQTNGFVFKYCNITGNGKSYLGRAYKAYSTVIFYKTSMSNVIVPEGWFSWKQAGQESAITYAEIECDGPGASMSGRVNWMKKLEDKELSHFIGSSFVDGDGWREKMPSPVA
ncbi:probable pectinesterase 55 [Syzygium oleosum]|uniref:probable pectinesterase 55 n=1 Tax=Syzygium oleosum TaxID=219896 RepID=UPI0011D21F37|nr:probable pectinesterase 55 [Syzygium oleosum]